MTDLSTLHPIWASVPASIWKAIPCSQGPSLIIEARTDSRKVFGYTLELRREILRPFAHEFAWTETLVEVHGQTAIWQGLKDEGMPDPLGIIAIDTISGAKRWSHPALSYLRTGPDIIIAGEPERPEVLLFISVETGEVRHRVSRSNLPTDLLNKFDQNRHSVWRFPAHVTPESEDYAKTASKIKAFSDRTIQGPISTMLYDDVEIIHAYFPEEGTLNSMLLLFGQDGRSKVIPTGTYPSGYTLDPFFLYQGFLIWIQYPDTIGYLAL